MAKNKNISKIKKLEEIGIAVQEAIDVYLQCAHVKKLLPRTRKGYEDELARFGKWCAEHSVIQKDKSPVEVVPLLNDSSIMLHQITDQVVHEYLEYIKETSIPKKRNSNEISSYTLVSVVRTIRTFLNWCLLDEQYSQYVQAIVIKRIEKPQLVEAITEAFTVDQVERLFKACDKEESEHLQMRDRAILSVLLDSGLRATELVTLTIEHVCLDNKDAYVRILGKGSKWGEVGLGEKARRAVQKYIRQFREPTIEFEVQQANPNLSDRQLKQLVQQQMKQSLLFVNRHGDRLTRNGLWKMMKRLEDWSGIEISKCSPHVWRHTFSCMFMENGGDVYRLSKLLRHSSVKVTELYLKSLSQSFARRGSQSVLDNLK